VPTDRVKVLLDEVMSVQTDPNLQGPESRQRRRESVEKVIEKNFDFDAMSRQALGPAWEERSAAERSEFQSIFRALFVDSYTRLVLDFLGREKILYKAEEAVGDGYLVKTTILRANEDISADYTVAVIGDSWLVSDVAIDGVSIVQNYRKSFGRVIQKSSYSALLEKMRLQQKAIDKQPVKE
jgi:phospholipid transport system substrate-binding protein